MGLAWCFRENRAILGRWQSLSTATAASLLELPKRKPRTSRLQRCKWLQHFQIFDARYLITLDGSRYFSSESVHCAHCLTTTKNGTTRYHHDILQAAIVHPDKRQVLPLAPVFVRNSDADGGNYRKQDCEITAGYRMLADAPRDPNPAAEYLESLHPSVRRSMRRALDRAIAIFTDGAVTKATAFDWSQIDRLQIEKLRSVMVDRDAADGTVNHMLSGVRSTARIAWDHGLVIDKTRTAFKDEPNEKPQQRRRAGRYVQTGRGSAVVRGDRYRSYWCS